MQLANLQVKPIWYFVFGGAQKTSLAHQFASEHKMIHVEDKSASSFAFKDHKESGLVVECSATLFRQLQSIRPEIQVVFVCGGELTAEEIKIKRDYEKIGRCASVKSADYKCFRKALYPCLVILYGPCPIQKRFLVQNYFNFSGYVILKDSLSANEMITKLPKSANYFLVGFVPLPSELSVIEEYFDVEILHLKHQRTELNNQQEFFNQEAKIVPELSKKPYFYTIPTSTTDLQIADKIGETLLPTLIYVNGSSKEELCGAMEYIEKTDSLLLNANQIAQILKRKGLPALAGNQLLGLLVNIIWMNADKDVAFFTEFPCRPEQFYMIEEKTRNFSLFADCQKPQKYQLSQQMNAPIYFLESHRRKHFQPDYSFEKQLRTGTKYFIISGPPGVGKTSAAKHIATNYGCKHIECETYLPTLKEKLLTPEDGEELPFSKIIKHFNSLIQQSAGEPLLIDGINIEWKDIQSWVATNGAPIIINLKTDEKELVKRGKKKAGEDAGGDISEEDINKFKELLAKNAQWADQFNSRCPNTTLYQIDFSPQLILAERLLDDILKPRVYLIQSNSTTLYQNISVRYNLDFHDLRKESVEEIAFRVRVGCNRDIVLCNYLQTISSMVSQDFYEIEKNIGTIRYIGVWSPETTETKDEEMKLEAPPKQEKPKPAEGQEGEAPPAQEEGEPKKKALNIFDHTWTKNGNAKNMSQWFFNLKKCVNKKECEVMDCFKIFGDILEQISKDKTTNIYHSITMK